MSETDSYVIQTQGLSKSYKKIEALKPLKLTVRPNSIFGFLGPNGAGKTTTIKLLLGLIRPTGGSATVFGKDIVQESIAIRARVGYLPQEPRFYEHMTARQIFRYTARFYFKGPAGEIEKRVEETLELVGLADKADRPIKSFSGGERQRVGIGQAQVNYPDLLILDEPAASLDPMGRRDVLEVMGRLQKHTTVFYSTPNLNDVQKVSDTVAILNHGELVEHGPIEELLAGGEGTAYNVTLKGDTVSAQARLARQEWVSDIRSKERNGSTIWTVSVSDQAVAEAQLLRLLLADEQLVVTEFKRKEYELEEVFMNIVEANNEQ